MKCQQQYIDTCSSGHFEDNIPPTQPSNMDDILYTVITGLSILLLLLPLIITYLSCRYVQIPCRIVFIRITKRIRRKAKAIEYNPRYYANLRYGVSETQGSRRSMEDRHRICCNFYQMIQKSISHHIPESIESQISENYKAKEKAMYNKCFALFDGHMGVSAAEFCCKMLPQIIADCIVTSPNNPRYAGVKMSEFPSQPYQSLLDKCKEGKSQANLPKTSSTPSLKRKNKGSVIPKSSESSRDLKDACVQKCTKNQLGESDHDFICDAIDNAFIVVDELFKEQCMEHQDPAGAVGVISLLIGQDLYVANIGDSRAVICRKGKPFGLTQTHTPKMPCEKERVIREGGEIWDDRLGGNIAVSRAIGDYQYHTKEGKQVTEAWKIPGMSSVPYVTKNPLKNEDEFLILACDGLWDVVSNQNAVNAVRRKLRRDPLNCEGAAQVLVENAIHFHSSDNVTVMVVGFADFYKETNSLRIVEPRPVSQSGLRRRFQIRRSQSSITISNVNSQQRVESSITHVTLPNTCSVVQSAPSRLQSFADQIKENG